MLRSMMMLTSAAAFALPLALSQPADARPLATPTQPAEWCWGDCDSDKEDDDDVSIEIDLKLCVKWEFDNRANVEACEILTGPQCLARCTADAVAASCELALADGASPRSLAACGAEQIDLCREQCDSGGAGFCELRGKNPPGIGKGHCKHGPGSKHPTPGHQGQSPGHQHDDNKCKDDHGHGKGDNDFVFVDIDICIDLEIDIDIDKG